MKKTQKIHKNAWYKFLLICINLTLIFSSYKRYIFKITSITTTDNIHVRVT